MRRIRFASVAPNRRWLAAVTLFVAATITVAQAPPEVPKAPASSDAEATALDQKLLAQSKDSPDVMNNLTYLSDVIGPRLTGSDNLKRANEWAAERMKAYGLSNVHLEPWTIPVGWQRGTATAKLIEPDNGRTLTVASYGWSPGTKGPIEGDVVIFRARNREDLAKYKGKLKNAIILQGTPSTIRPITDPGGIPGAAPERRRPDAGNNPPAGGPTPPAGAGRPNRGNADRTPSGGVIAPPPPPSESLEGEEQPPAPPETPKPAQPPMPKPNAPAGGQPPAAGGQPPARGFDRGGEFEQMRNFRREMAEFLRTEGAACTLIDAGKPHGLLNMTGGWRNTDRNPDRASAPEPLPQLFMCHEHYAMLWRLASRPAPAKTRVALEITNTFIPGPVTVYNTVGEITGVEKPDEFVVLGAHLDSWDLGQGTTDNGTGSCVVLETARILAKSGVRPRRTIRFVLFTGEEQGLHGSREYVKAHKEEMPRTSLAVVHDTGTGRVTAIATQGREPLKAIFEKEFTAIKDLGVKEINARRMSGSDHQSFDGAGVPGIMFQQDPAEYRFTHHSQSDTLDKAKEPDLIQGAQVMSIMALRVANLPNLLPRETRERRAGGN